MPTRIEVRNATAQGVRAVLIDDEDGPRQPPSTFNRREPGARRTSGVGITRRPERKAPVSAGPEGEDSG